MNLINSSLSRASASNEIVGSDIVEVSLLLSRQQIALLAQQAQKRGMTSAQFLRQSISTVCQSGTDNS